MYELHVHVRVSKKLFLLHVFVMYIFTGICTCTDELPIQQIATCRRLHSPLPHVRRSIFTSHQDHQHVVVAAAAVAAVVEAFPYTQDGTHQQSKQSDPKFRFPTALNVRTNRQTQKLPRFSNVIFISNTISGVLGR